MSVVIAVTTPDGKTTRFVGDKIYWVNEVERAWKFKSEEQAREFAEHPNSCVKNLTTLHYTYEIREAA